MTPRGHAPNPWALEGVVRQQEARDDGAQRHQHRQFQPFLDEAADRFAEPIDKPGDEAEARLAPMQIR